MQIQHHLESGSGHLRRECERRVQAVPRLGRRVPEAKPHEPVPGVPEDLDRIRGLSIQAVLGAEVAQPRNEGEIGAGDGIGR